MSVSRAMICPPVQDSAVAAQNALAFAGVEKVAGRVRAAHSSFRQHSWIGDGRGGDGGDAFAPADETEFLVRRRLDRDPVGRDAEHGDERIRHCLPKRTDPRRFANQGDVGIGDPAACARARSAPPPRRRCARPRPSIADRMAENACRYRRHRRSPEARRSARGGRHRHPNGPTASDRAELRRRTEPPRRPVRRSGRRSRCRCGYRETCVASILSFRSAFAMSRAQVSLTLSGEPSTSRTGMAAHSAMAASSVKSSRPSDAARAWAAWKSAKGKPCGVCAAKRPARDIGPRDKTVRCSFLQRVRDGQRGQGCPSAPSMPAITRRNERRIGEGPNAVMDEDCIRRIAGQCLQRVPGRSLPCRATRDRPSRSSASSPTASRKRLSSSAMDRDDHMSRFQGVPETSRSVWASMALPPIRRYCFGPSCGSPARSPRPAATMMAATFGVLHSGLRIGRAHISAHGRNCQTACMRQLRRLIEHGYQLSKKMWVPGFCA